MHGKRASLIVNLRSGHTVLKVPEIGAVLNAADWKTDVYLKEYSGETLQLAEQAARDGHDVAIGYGGDGTINAVVNGVLYAGGKRGETGETEEIHEKPKKAGKHRQYFLLHAGIGVDAAIMAHINKPLKYEVGKIAFDLAGLKELPRQRPFPVEISSLNTSGKLD